MLPVHFLLGGICLLPPGTFWTLSWFHWKKKMDSNIVKFSGNNTIFQFFLFLKKAYLFKISLCIYLLVVVSFLFFRTEFSDFSIELLQKTHKKQVTKTLTKKSLWCQSKQIYMKNVYFFQLHRNNGTHCLRLCYLPQGLKCNENKAWHSMHVNWANYIQFE